MDRTESWLRGLLPVGRELPEGAFEARHRLASWVVAAHLPVLAVIGLAGGEGVAHVLAEVAAVGGLAAAGTSSRLGRRLRMALATTALVGCSAVLVHFTGGLIESHFHFFAVVAFVTLYQSWLPFLLCIGWVVVHHGLVGVLEPTAVYSHQAAIERPALWALIHGGFVLLASLASLAAWRASELERLRAESVLAASPQPTYGADPSGRIVFANRALAEFVGSDEDDLIGRTDHEVLHPAAAGPCPVCAVVRSGMPHRLDEVELRATEDATAPAELHVRPVRERDRLFGSVVSFWDISARQAQQRELEALALSDALTGLANRTLLRDRLGHACAGLRRGLPGLSLVLLDLDRFKRINETLGDRVGDELLAEVGRRLLAGSRPEDTVARIGADEFAVLCPGVVDAAAADRVAARLADAVTRRLAVDGSELLVTASCGVRVASGPDDDADRILADADLARLAAKADGGGRIVRYHDELREQAGSGRDLGSELQLAIDQDELVLHYQPIWSLDGLRPVGVEALVRWNHPERGLLGPGAFIPLAESTGLIGPLGTRVLTLAAAQLAAWRVELGAVAADLYVAVNVSVRQLRDPAFVTTVESVLADTGLPPAVLCLEITETVLAQDGDGTAEVLGRLRELGVNLAIDDFGTGFSSLATLRRLPVNELKIDRSFVQSLRVDAGSQQVVRAIVGLAHALDLVVVAEGVEDDHELQATRALACDRVQGFGLARPTTATDVEVLLRRGTVGAATRA